MQPIFIRPWEARGMNLGIEDAWVLSDLIARGNQKAYDSLRKHIDAKVVK
jgi:2-polyprenyl-6-methoxyphenol hydroxylase-like FAD-dependent oxidoreductase